MFIFGFSGNNQEARQMPTSRGEIIALTHKAPGVAKCETAANITSGRNKVKRLARTPQLPLDAP